MIIVTATLNGVTETINGNGQRLVSGSIDQDVKAIESFTFDIDPTNIGYDLIQSRKTRIKCVNDKTGRVEFNGRVLLSEEKMDSRGAVTKTVTCEGLLGLLHDTIQPYSPELNYTLNDFIDLVLNNHMAQAEPEKWFLNAGADVEVAGTGLVYKGLQYQTTFDTLKTKLLDVYGGELEVIDYDDGGFLYLRYVEQIGETRSTVIELGSNMQDASREVSPLNIVTRVYPLGAKLSKEVMNEDGSISTVETEERLTLVGHTLDDGTVMTLPWIDDEEKIETLGIIVGTLDFPDITEQYNLYRRAQEYMTHENRVNLSHTLTAIDLRELGHDIDGLYCGDSYRVRNKLIGLDEVLRIIKKTIDIHTPYKSSITIGEKKATLSNIQATESGRTQQLLEKVQDLNKQTSAISSQVSQLSYEIESTVNGVVATATKDFVTVSEIERVEGRIDTTVEHTAEEIKISFGNDLKTISEEMAANLTSALTELHAYIRGYMEVDAEGKEHPVLELGAQSSDIICYLTNGRLDFKMNGMPIAYIANDENGVSQLFITNATILQRLNLGAFTFKMRDNNNLSMIKTREV